MKYLAERCHSLDWHLRNDHTVVYGIDECPAVGTPYQLMRSEYDAAISSINDNFQYKPDLLLLKDAERTGKPDPKRATPRPIKIKFALAIDKFAVMGSYLRLRGPLLADGIRVRDDLPESVRKFRAAAYKNIDRLFKAKRAGRFVGDGVRLHSGRKFEGTAEDLHGLVNDMANR